MGTAERRLVRRYTEDHALGLLKFVGTGQHAVHAHAVLGGALVLDGYELSNIVTLV